MLVQPCVWAVSIYAGLLCAGLQFAYICGAANIDQALFLQQKLSLKIKDPPNPQLRSWDLFGDIYEQIEEGKQILIWKLFAAYD